MLSPASISDPPPSLRTLVCVSSTFMGVSKVTAGALPGAGSSVISTESQPEEPQPVSSSDMATAVAPTGMIFRKTG